MSRIPAREFAIFGTSLTNFKPHLSQDGTLGCDPRPIISVIRASSSGSSTVCDIAAVNVGETKSALQGFSVEGSPV